MLLDNWHKLRRRDDFAAPDEFIADDNQGRRDETVLLRLVTHHVQFHHFDLPRELRCSVLGLFFRTLTIGAWRRCAENFDL